MKIRKLAAPFVGALLLCLCSIADADDWAKTDKVLFGTYVAFSAIDASQTIWAMNQYYPNGKHKYREINPLYGDYPGEAQIWQTKAAVAGVIWLIADQFPRARTNVLWAANAIQFGVVASNYSIGLKVEF